MATKYNYRYNYELFKELYYHELDLKEKSSNRIPISLTLSSLILGYLGYILAPKGLLRDKIDLFIFNYDKLLLKSIFSINLIFAIIIIGILFSASLCIFATYKAIVGYKYAYLPSTMEIDSKMDDFFEYYEMHKLHFESRNISKKRVIEEQLQKNFYKILRDSATNNRLENKRKMYWIRMIALSQISVIFLSILFTIINYIS